MAGARYTFEAIGTSWTIEVFDDTVPKHLLSDIRQRIDVFDKAYSRFRDDSLVSCMARAAGEYSLPDDAQPLLNFYEQLYRVTNGAVTPLIGQALGDAGYDASYSLSPGQVSAPPKWEEVLSYDFPKLTLTKPALLDFGAAGKGYLVDLIGQLLASSGVNSYCINAGGDMLYRTVGDKPMEIALEHPADATQAVGVARLHNQSICGSSGNRRAWGRYHHILSPHTLDSPRHIAGLWVVADTGLIADGLATALFFVQPQRLMEHFDFEYAILREDFSLVTSQNFPADFFTHAESETLT